MENPVTDSEGSWLDYNHSYPSRNRNADISVTYVLHGLLCGSKYSPSEGFHKVSLPHMALVDPRLWNKHLTKLPYAFETETVRYFHPGFQPPKLIYLNIILIARWPLAYELGHAWRAHRTAVLKQTLTQTKVRYRKQTNKSTKRK